MWDARVKNQRSPHISGKHQKAVHDNFRTYDSWKHTTTTVRTIKDGG